VKPLIRLYYDGLGLILEHPCGVLYSNQTTGTCCEQPEVEGVFVPLDAEVQWQRLASHFEGPKYGGSGAMLGLDGADADLIDAVLRDQRMRAWWWTARPAESHEAWVHVIVTRENDLTLSSGFGPYPRPAVLTWPNSD
jgi:Family of unknown function (DUF6210)